MDLNNNNSNFNTLNSDLKPKEHLNKPTVINDNAKALPKANLSKLTPATTNTNQTVIKKPEPQVRLGLF